MIEMLRLDIDVVVLGEAVRKRTMTHKAGAAVRWGGTYKTFRHIGFPYCVQNDSSRVSTIDNSLLIHRT